MANDRLINSTQGESIINGLTTIANKLDALKPISAADNGKVVVNGELTAQTAYPSTITENNTYDTTNYNSITVEVESSANLEDKSVTPTTSQQTITAGQGYDGLGTVTVAAVTSAIDQNIVAGNIKKDVQILGVTGSYEGSGGGHNATLTTEDTVFNYVSGYMGLLTAVTIPNGITSIDDDAFHGCDNLATITIPSSVTSIGYNAFGGCNNLATITIPSTVTTIGNYAFEGAGLTAVTIPNSVTSIGDGTFQSCSSLTAVTIPNSVTSIGDGTFYGCDSLTAVTIPNSVTSIGEDAFGQCYQLATITINKAEGSITGAPWGAPNATVVWTG